MQTGKKSRNDLDNVAWTKRVCVMAMAMVNFYSLKLERFAFQIVFFITNVHYVCRL